MDIRMIAHDMRTPLNALSLSIQAALASSDPKAVRQALEVANRNATVLAANIEALIETDLTGKGTLVLRQHQPLDLVAKAIDQIIPLVEIKHQSIDSGQAVALPPLIVDGNRIVRVLVNLLANAIRFGPEHSRIHVNVRFRLNDGHSVVVFSVIDEGPGVPEGEIDQIFVEGVSIARGTKPSSGLGLSVCKEIVEAHGGRVWVETGRQRGAAFSFSIPADNVFG